MHNCPICQKSFIEPAEFAAWCGHYVETHYVEYSYYTAKGAPHSYITRVFHGDTSKKMIIAFGGFVPYERVKMLMSLV